VVNDEEIPSNDESETTNGAVKTMTPSDCDKSLRRLRIVFDKYLECPSLLDPYLEERIYVSLSGKARDLWFIQFMNRQFLLFPTTTTTSSKIDTEEIPADEVIQDMEAQINAILSNLKRILSTLYALSKKVCGKKQVQRFFTHDACDVEPVLIYSVLYVISVMEIIRQHHR